MYLEVAISVPGKERADRPPSICDSSKDIFQRKDLNFRYQHCKNCNCCLHGIFWQFCVSVSVTSYLMISFFIVDACMSDRSISFCSHSERGDWGLTLHERHSRIDVERFEYCSSFACFCLHLFSSKTSTVLLDVLFLFVFINCFPSFPFRPFHLY